MESPDTRFIMLLPVDICRPFWWVRECRVLELIISPLSGIPDAQHHNTFCVSHMCGALGSMIGFIISYYIYILMNIILIKVHMSVSATAGTSSPLAGV